MLRYKVSKYEHANNAVGLTIVLYLGLSTHLETFIEKLLETYRKVSHNK